MEGESQLTISTTPKPTSEFQKKRKWRKRGKQIRMTEDIDKEYPDINVAADAVENTNAEESIDSNTDKWNMLDSPDFDNDKNERNDNDETPEIIINYLSRDEFEPPDEDYYMRKDLNLTADNNVSIFKIRTPKGDNISTDSIATSCVRTSENLLKTEKNTINRLNSEDVERLYASNTTEPEEQLYNPRALPREADTYELEKFDRNVLIIFNQKNFGTHQRVGTDQDVKALKMTFEAFNFDVLPYTDRTVNQIQEILQAISSQDLSEYGCVAIAVLTHGDIDGTLSAKDGDYSEMDIINALKTHKNHSLITKARLIFIQACRGPNALAGVPVLRKGKVQSSLNYDTKPYTLPVEADMLVVHSSYAGNRAHRDEVHGSWFIQTLCKKINEMAPKHDLETILTHIKHEVAIDKEHEIYNRRTDEYDINKQMPVVTSTLIRKLFLTKCDGDTPAAISNADVMFTDIVVDSRNSAAAPEPCACALNYYDYMKYCLRHYVEDNRDDTTAMTLLDLTETLKNEPLFNSTKEKCAVAIADHLKDRVKQTERYKFIYIK